MLEIEQLYALGKLRGCIRAAQNFVSKAINAHHLDILFIIALNPGITRGEINKMLPKQSMSTTKRYVGDLTTYCYDRDKIGGGRKPGFGLIEERQDDNDLKLKHLYLTDKGTMLCESLANRVMEQQMSDMNIEELEVPKGDLEAEFARRYLQTEEINLNEETTVKD